MNRIAFMIVLAILGLAAVIGILRFMSEPVPQKIVQPNEELAMPAEEMTVIQEENTQTPPPIKTPENKQQVMPQPKPQPVRVAPQPEPEPERYYEATGN